MKRIKIIATFASRCGARMHARWTPSAVCAFVGMLSGCAVYDSSLLNDVGAPLASAGHAGRRAFGDSGSASGGAPMGGRSGEAGNSVNSADAGAAGQASEIGGVGGEAGAGTSATSGGSAQGGSAQAGSAASAGAGGTGTAHDLSTGKQATASTQQAGNEIGKGNDGNLSTRWCGKDDSLPQWWRVDLGATHPLSSFIVAFQITDRAYTYDIETSPDDKLYTRRLTVTATGAQQTRDFPSGVSARYVRITGTHTEPLYPGVTVWASFNEFSVLGF